MRGLPDHPTDARSVSARLLTICAVRKLTIEAVPRYPREEWIDQGDAERKPGFSNQQEAADSDQAGDYVVRRATH
jgi:hypothetical protein